jgi:oxalate decarboxylase/phosphoglucose isomerase-like protein (cupin superfamily)
MKASLKEFKGKKIVIKVKDSIKDGKNIYKNNKGHGNEVNTVLTDLSNSGLKKLTITMNILYPGKVNKEFKMTRGHKHNAEEVYVFLEGTGQILVDKKMFKVKKGDLVTIPLNSWHRVINKGRKKLVFLTVFGRHGHSHLKSY